jgi:hypothetical protein
MKAGDKVSWKYTHHLNSRATVEIVKTGVILEITGEKKNFQYVSGTHAKVLFKGNKYPSKVPISELVLNV